MNVQELGLFAKSHGFIFRCIPLPPSSDQKSIVTVYIDTDPLFARVTTIPYERAIGPDDPIWEKLGGLPTGKSVAELTIDDFPVIAAWNTHVQKLDAEKIFTQLDNQKQERLLKTARVMQMLLNNLLTLLKDDEKKLISKTLQYGKFIHDTSIRFKNWKQRLEDRQAHLLPNTPAESRSVLDFLQTTAWEIDTMIITLRGKRGVAPETITHLQKIYEHLKITNQFYLRLDRKYGLGYGIPSRPHFGPLFVPYNYLSRKRAMLTTQETIEQPDDFEICNATPFSDLIVHVAMGGDPKSFLEGLIPKPGSMEHVPEDSEIDELERQAYEIVSPLQIEGPPKPLSSPYRS